MTEQSGIGLVQRLEVLWRMQSSAIECLAYVTSIGEAARKLPSTIEAHHVFTSLYVNNAQSALLFAAHLFDSDNQSISATSTAEYAKMHLEEFVRFHAENSDKQQRDRNLELTVLIDAWLVKFASDTVVRDIKHVRDWTLAHTDKRALTRPQEVPGVPFEEIRRLLGVVNEFVNDLLVRIEDRGLESGEFFLEPDIKSEVFDTAARLAVSAELFAREIERQGTGPALERMLELKKSLEEEMPSG